MDVPALCARLRGRLAPALILLATLGCSHKGTSAPSPCDNAGTDLIVFASDRGHHGQYDLYLFDADAGGYRLLQNLNSATAEDSMPAISSDGQLIAFSTRRGTTGLDISVYERASCSFLSTPGLSSAGDETDPAFSGDTKRLFFTRDTLGHRRIREVTAGSINFVPLPGLDTLGAAYDDWAPAPDQTGDRVAFVSDREGSPHLYLYTRSSHSVDPLVGLRASGATDLEPSLSSDARYLAFASDRTDATTRGGYDVHLYDLTTVTEVLLPGLNTSGNERHPSLNTNGNYMAVQSDSSAYRGWVVRLYYRLSKLSAAIGRQDTTANDISPSVRFP